MRKVISLFLLISVISCFFVSGCGNNEEKMNKARACGATMRVMLGAIEMYNMDHSTFMNELNEANYKVLVSEGYIKKDFDCVCPETKKFQYSSTCDLSDPSYDLFTALKCANHGTIKDIEDKYPKK